MISKFYPDQKANTAYKALRRLKRHGLIYRCQYEVGGSGVLYALTSKGFKLIEKQLPDLRENGWKSENQHHDLLVTALHLGEWLVQLPPGADVFSEQELRRFHVCDYPSWVPQTDTHRPDGYWKVALSEGVGTIALEVELKVKSLNWYEIIAQFYNDQPSVFRVVWLVTSLANAKRILSRLGYEMAPSESCHTFVVVDDFQRMGWDAPLHFGPESGHPLSFVLGSTGSNRSQSIYPLCLLDTRKYPFATPRSTQNLKTPIPAQGRLPLSLTPPQDRLVPNHCTQSPSYQFPINTYETRRKET